MRVNTETITPSEEFKTNFKHNCNCYINYNKLIKYAGEVGKEIPQKKEEYKVLIEEALEQSCKARNREDIKEIFSFLSEKAELINYIYSFINTKMKKNKEYYFVKIIKVISIELDKK